MRPNNSCRWAHICISNFNTIWRRCGAAVTFGDSSRTFLTYMFTYLLKFARNHSDSQSVNSEKAWPTHKNFWTTGRKNKQTPTLLENRRKWKLVITRVRSFAVAGVSVGGKHVSSWRSVHDFARLVFSPHRPCSHVNGALCGRLSLARRPLSTDTFFVFGHHVLICYLQATTRPFAAGT